MTAFPSPRPNHRTFAPRAACTLLLRAARSLAVACALAPFVSAGPALAAPEDIARPDVRTLLYVPQEPATVFWERDLGVPRKEVTGCENLDPAADWFDLCKNLLGLSPTFVNLTLGDSQSPLQTPTVLLRAGKRRIRVTFKPVFPERATQRAASAPAPVVTRDAQTGHLQCDAKVAPRSGLSVVRIEWRLSRKGESTVQVIEEASLLPRHFEGATDVRCRAILFDGLLFLARESSAHPTLFSSAAPVDASPLELTPDTLSQFEAGTLLGRLRAGEAYACETLWSDGREADPCVAFDDATGRFSTRLLTEAGARNGTRGPGVFQIELTRRDGDDLLAKVAVPLLVDAGPVTSKAALTVSLVRDTLTEHLECRGPDGALPLEPVRWMANGQPLRGWQQSYLPAFLLAAGGSYACTLGASTSEQFRYDDLQDAFRVPSELRLPPGKKSVLFSVSVPPFRRDGLPSAGQTLACEPSPGFTCERIVDASEDTGTVFFQLARVEEGNASRNPQVRLRLRAASADIERTVPVLGEGLRLFSEGGVPREIPLSFTDGQWTCEWPSDDDRTHVESVHWYLGKKEITTGRLRASLAPPDVLVPTPLLCVIVVGDPETGVRTVAFGQTMLQPRGPSFDEGASRLVVLSKGPLEFSRGVVHAGAPLKKVACKVAFPGSGAERALACRLEADARGDGDSRRLRMAVELTSDDVDGLRSLLLQEAKVDPFKPLSVRFDAVLSTDAFDFSLTSPLEFVLPNTRPKVALFAHYVDAKGRTSCVALAEDPDANHVSLTLSPRFHALTRTTFTTREPHVAVASVRALLPPGEGAAIAPRLAARIVLDAHHDGAGAERAGCRGIVSDGTSLFETFSVPSSERDIRQSLFERTREPLFVPLPSPLSSGPSPTPSPTSRPLASEDLERASSPLRGPRAGDALTVTQIRAHFDSAGTHDLPFPPGVPANPRLASCEGPRALCSALFVAQGRLKISLTSTVPGGTVRILLEPPETTQPRQLVVADISNATYAPLGSTPLPPCAELLHAQARGGLPSYLHLSTFARVAVEDGRRIDRAVPSSRVVGALSAGAEDIICEATIHWAGQTLGIRTSSLRETFVPKVRGRSDLLDSPFSGNGVLAALPTRTAPRDARLSLPSLVAASEAEAREFAASFLAVEWKVTRCEVQTKDARNACDVDPASLLIYDLPTHTDFTVDATVEHKVLGRTRRLRVSQSFRGRGSNAQTLLPSVLLRRTGNELECIASGSFPLGTAFRHELRLNSSLLELTGSKEPRRRFALTGARAATPGVFSCHVSWPGGAESAFLPSSPLDVARSLEGVCIVDEGTLEGPRATPCTWPDGVALNETAAQDDENLRKHLERELGTPPTAWVKAIFHSTESPWRSSFLLTPTSPRRSDGGLGPSRETKVAPPWSSARPLCLADNVDRWEGAATAGSSGAPAPSRESFAETALNAGVSRLARTCGFLHFESSAKSPPHGDGRAFDATTLYRNELALGPEGPVLPPPFVATLRSGVSRTRARLAAFGASVSQSETPARDNGSPVSPNACFLRCRGTPDTPAALACETILSEITSLSASDRQVPHCARAEREDLTPALPRDVSVLELVLKKQDTPSMPAAVRAVGLVVP